MKNVLTTGQVAKMLHTSPRTVTKWVDSGRLQGYRLPLSPDRRIPRESLLEFIRQHGMPIPPELGLPVLLVVGDLDIAEQLQRRLAGWKIEAADSVWTAATIATKAGGQLRGAVVSGQIGRLEAKEIAQALANQVRLRIVLCTEDDDGSIWTSDAALMRMQYPVGPDIIARAILLGMTEAPK
jgi:excisionase family DNA binding protein